MHAFSKCNVTTKTAALALLLNVSAWASEVYVWTDEDGVTHYSSLPPPEANSAEAVELGEVLPGGTAGIGGLQGKNTDADSLSQLCALALARLQELEEGRVTYEVGPDGERQEVIDDRRTKESSTLSRYVAGYCE